MYASMPRIAFSSSVWSSIGSTYELRTWLRTCAKMRTSSIGSGKVSLASAAAAGAGTTAVTCGAAIGASSAAKAAADNTARWSSEILDKVFMEVTRRGVREEFYAVWGLVGGNS